MEHKTLTSEPRDLLGRKTDALRNDGAVPAVLYGFGTEPVNVTVNRNAFLSVYRETGKSVVLDLLVAGVPHPVLIGEVQRDPLTTFVRHIDFRRIDVTHKIETVIPLVLEGVAPAVKELGGTLVQSLEEVEVKSLPNALVHNIKVDVSKLATFDDVVRVKDLVIPEGIEVETDGMVAVASVQPPLSEAEIAALDEAVDADVSKVEVTTEKKEETPAEGEAPKAEEKK